MFIILKRDWHVQDASSPAGTGLIPAGKHEVERIVIPARGNVPWLVLRGTRIGAAEAYWLDQKDVEIIDELDHATDRVCKDEAEVTV